ncbi:MAG TPA: hypothetical protein VIO36_13095 [Anaerolineaceae bacterium]
MIATNEQDDLKVCLWNPNPGKSLLADIWEASGQYSRFSLALMTFMVMLVGARAVRFMRGKM